MTTVTPFICNWCTHDSDVAVCITTETKQKKEQEYICCSDCLLAVVLKSLGKPKLKPRLKKPEPLPDKKPKVQIH